MNFFNRTFLISLLVAIISMVLFSNTFDHQAQLQLTVIDLVGRQVTNEIQLTALSGTRNIDLSGQADGVYILRIVKDGQHMMQERLILVK
jgi:hypothetical protein